MSSKTFRDKLLKCKAALIDVDGTLVEGSVSEGIGKGYLLQEWQRGNYASAAAGFLGAVKTIYFTKVMSDEQRGYDAFAAALSNAGCVGEESAYRFAEEFVKKHGLPSAADFVKFLNVAGLQTIAYTGGLDVSAKAASRHFGTRMALSNYRIEENRIIPSRYVWPQRPLKRVAAENFLDIELNLGLDECLVVGDAETDPPVMSGAMLSLAAPLAKQAVKDVSDYWAQSFGLFLREIR